MSEEKCVFDRLASTTTPTRKLAVACALKIINSRSRGDTTSNSVDFEFNNLSKYAD